jgi:hypothetical protein
MPYPTPHLEKLTAILANDKLPEADRPRIETTIATYRRWIADLEAVNGAPEEVLARMVALLNEYRNHIDIELVFDSPHDFLYRQKGQLKLDNSVIEEFLPRLVGNAILLPELAAMDMVLGPTPTYAAAYFNSSIDSIRPGGGMAIKIKNQDFSIAKPLYIRASHDAAFADSITQKTFLGYIAAECKTNLDKTMFQEAFATAHDTKQAVAGARYYLLCEWLDMAPQSTAPTDIDEIIILRKAKRMNSNIRANFSTVAGRAMHRASYVAFLGANPFRTEMFARFISHVRELIRNEQPEERSVLTSGYF